MEENKGFAEMDDIKVGDRVRVIKYGHLMYKQKNNYQEESDYFAKEQARINNEMCEILFGEDTVLVDIESVKGKSEPDNIYLDGGDMWWIDLHPELVGQEGVIVNVTNTQGRLKYALDGVKGKHAWYDRSQLDKI